MARGRPFGQSKEGFHRSGTHLQNGSHGLRLLHELELDPRPATSGLASPPSKAARIQLLTCTKGLTLPQSGTAEPLHVAEENLFRPPLPVLAC